MGNWIHLDESIKGRVNAIKRENERIINLLIELGVLRESMVPGWHVIYTESGPKDIKLDSFNPCIKLFVSSINGKCYCVNCSKENK
jgi:hypothetical protein